MEDVHLNSKNYRVLLQAMSRPGRMFRLDQGDQTSPFFPFLAIAKCLLDQEVSVCVIGNGRGETLAPAVISATGARAATLLLADFVFILGVTDGSSILQAKLGSPESPEHGATVVCSVNEEPTDAFDRFGVRLIGPGIPEKEGIAPEMSGIALEDLKALQIANADYPMGVDAVFTRKDGRVMCIPRSCRIHLR